MARQEARISFRDPGGRLVSAGGRILRVVNAAGAPHLRAFLGSRTASAFQSSGRLVRTEKVDDPEAHELQAALGGVMVVEHERLWFPSYPYEWPPEMLHAAGRLTLELARALVAEGLGLKDATPYNVAFRGPNPVFLDVLSAESRAADDPVWMAHAQFVRTFLLPLAASRCLGLPIGQLMTGRRDGLEPEEIGRWLKWYQRMRPPLLGLVTIPVRLERSHGHDPVLYRKRRTGNPEKARFILDSLYGRLQRALKRLAPAADRTSAWSGYLSKAGHYSAEQFAAKEAFVGKALEETRPATVLDVGANTGHFSALAARAGARVVAIDSDETVVGRTWRKAAAEGLDILPLCVDLTRPSPGIGWRNQECLPFLERASGAFDCVLMLAVVHHMLVTERIPLDEIVGLAAELTRGFAILEFVGPQDPMFQRLVRGREHLHSELSPEVFEAACRKRFEIVRRQHQEGTARWLYLLKLTRGPTL